MLFTTKYDKKVIKINQNNVLIKINKNHLIRDIKETDVLDVSLIEPVDKSSVRVAKQEIDKLIRNNHISLIVVRHKK